jgi:hypothetical protein
MLRYVLHAPRQTALTFSLSAGVGAALAFSLEVEHVEHDRPLVYSIISECTELFVLLLAVYLVTLLTASVVSICTPSSSLARTKRSVESDSLDFQQVHLVPEVVCAGIIAIVSVVVVKVTPVSPDDIFSRVKVTLYTLVSGPQLTLLVAVVLLCGATVRPCSVNSSIPMQVLRSTLHGIIIPVLSFCTQGELSISSVPILVCIALMMCWLAAEIVQSTAGRSAPGPAAAEPFHSDDGVATDTTSTSTRHPITTSRPTTVTIPDIVGDPAARIIAVILSGLSCQILSLFSVPALSPGGAAFVALTGMFGFGMAGVSYLFVTDQKHCVAAKVLWNRVQASFVTVYIFAMLWSRWCQDALSEALHDLPDSHSHGLL